MTIVSRQGKRKKKQEKKINKASFANKIIFLCVMVSLGITAAVIYEYHRLNTVTPSNVLGTLFGFWGGELLIIALRQIFGSDVIRKHPNRYEGNADEDIPSEDNGEMFP